jgi:hypothetical protein
MVTPNQLAKQVQAAVERRGQKAKELWFIVGGTTPGVSPQAALENLKRMANFVRADMGEETRQLVNSLENVIKSPPMPPGLGRGSH